MLRRQRQVDEAYDSDASLEGGNDLSNEAYYSDTLFDVDNDLFDIDEDYEEGDSIETTDLYPNNLDLGYIKTSMSATKSRFIVVIYTTVTSRSSLAVVKEYITQTSLP
jgi:hypothetical protein